MSYNDARVAKKARVKELRSKKNVVSVGVGLKHTGGHCTDEACVVIGVSRKMSNSNLKSKDMIPKYLGNCKTDVVEMGTVRALEQVDRLRPAPGGISIGHKDITAGTLGCLVTKNNETFILSNNHVLANTNDANLGDPILQPGPHDGGTVANDQIGTLAEFASINFGGGLGGGGSFWDFFLALLCQLFGVGCAEEGEPNRIDAALALPTTPGMVQKEILGIGAPTGWSAVVLNQPIKKSGRTTELTQDVVLQIDATVDVQYGAGKIATFEDQIIAGPMSAGGDSGSAVLDLDNKVIGLLFAGSDQVTILNPIEHVLNEFNVDIVV